MRGVASASEQEEVWVRKLPRGCVAQIRRAGSRSRTHAVVAVVRAMKFKLEGLDVYVLALRGRGAG